MKIWVDYDEWYPVFSADDGTKSAKYNLNPWGKEVEVTPEFYAECEQVFTAFEAIQKQLQALSDYKD
jgi:hypothetical protein